MSLQRKENNLCKAQKRLEKVSKRSKQFQIDFRRKHKTKCISHKIENCCLLKQYRTKHDGIAFDIGFYYSICKGKMFRVFLSGAKNGIMES